MAVQAQFMFGGLAGCLLPCGGGGGGGLAEEQMQALLPAAAPACNKAHQYQYQYSRAAGVVVASAAKSELTCNGGIGVVPPPRKRGREAQGEQYVSSPPPALLPLAGTYRTIAGEQLPATADRLAESAMASTSGRPAASVADALVSELRQHGAEIDGLVRAECDRLRAGLEQARKRQCLALVGAAAAAPALREKEAELAAARRRAADLEELLRQAAAECQAWRGLARSNEAVAAGLRATIDEVLLVQGALVRPGEEGFGDSGTDDAQSWCFVEVKNGGAAAATSSPAPAGDGKWACKACGSGEASVLLLPCRHLCLCEACEPRTEACPVCSGAKNASIHVAPN